MVLRDLGSFELRYTIVCDKPYQRCTEQQEKTQEHPSSVKRRLYHYWKALPGQIPHAVAISSDHTKQILARRHVRIIGCSPRASFDPVSVQSVHLVLKLNLVRFNK